MSKFSNLLDKFIWLVLIFITCCGEDDASTWSHRSSELVLDNRQAFTGRLLTTTDTDVNDRLSQQRFQEAMLTRASGGAYVRVGTADCLYENSSVSIVGDFTVLGSAHALGDDVGVETRIDLAFENQTRFPDVSNTLSTAGDFQVYSPSYSPEDPLVQVYLSRNTDSTSEESPFLAERLFQLGFQKEGFESEDPRSDISNPNEFESRVVRNSIRYNWQVEVNLDSQTAASTYKVDAVTLSVLPLDLVDFLEQRAGMPGVEFKSPAPFFNRVTMKSHVLKGDDPLWLTHFKPLHPTEQKVASSILTTGQFRNKDDKSAFTICGKGVVVQDEVLHLTDLDGYEGSSGGGVYGCTYERCGVPAGDGNEDPRNFGVLRLAGLMAEAWTVNPNDKLGWGNSVPFSSNNHTRAHMFTEDQVRAYAQPREDKIINCTTNNSACFRYVNAL